VGDQTLMTMLLFQMLLLFATNSLSLAFSPASSIICFNRPFSSFDSLSSTTMPDQDEQVQIKSKVPVSRISVCAGELCQCQGEEYEYTGGASDAVIRDLKSLNLPFPIDEVGCLGACGMGTMVAVDFENGDSVMTDGLDSTLDELGISMSEEGNGTDDLCETLTIDEPNIDSDEGAITIEKNNASKKPPILADARDRMRQEAAESSENMNPWVNMVSYLAKKATDKIFGD